MMDKDQIRDNIITMKERAVISQTRLNVVLENLTCLVEGIILTTGYDGDVASYIEDHAGLNLIYEGITTVAHEEMPNIFNRAMKVISES